MLIKTTRSLGRAAVLATLVTAGLGSAAFAQDHEIKWASPTIKDDSISIHWLTKEILKSEIEARSDGAIKVQLFAKDQLGKLEEMPGQVRAGIIEGADMSEGALASVFPSVALLSIPYLFANREIAWEVLDGPFGDAFAEKLAQTAGLRILGYGEVGYRHFTTADTPIQSLEDLDGMKMRVMPSPVFVEMVEGLGASPTPVSWSELYSALQTNVVQGQENPIANLIQSKLYEVQHELTLDGHVYGPYFYLVSEKWYQSLPDDLKAAMRQSAVVTGNAMRGLAVGTEQKDRQFLESKGMTFHTLSQEEKEKFKSAARKAAMPLIEKDTDPELLALLKEEVARAEEKFGYAPTDF